MASSGSEAPPVLVMQLYSLPAGCPSPLGSISSLSGLVCRMICAMAGSSTPDCAQHMQPPAICLTATVFPAAAAVLWRATASIPTAPNSLTIIHQCCSSTYTTANTMCGRLPVSRPGGQWLCAHTSLAGFLATKLHNAVVLPTPREPVTIVVGTGSFSFLMLLLCQLG